MKERILKRAKFSGESWYPQRWQRRLKWVLGTSYPATLVSSENNKPLRNPDSKIKLLKAEGPK